MGNELCFGNRTVMEKPRGPPNKVKFYWGYPEPLPIGLFKDQPSLCVWPPT